MNDNKYKNALIYRNENEHSNEYSNENECMNEMNAGYQE